MTNTANTANASKKSAPLLPVYLICGEDELMRNEAITRLYARMSQIGDISFNSDRFSGESASGADIVAACNTMPFASPVRLVDVRDADKLKKADSEALVAYVSAPCETTVLALSAEKLAKNTRLYKAVASVGKTAVIDCSPKSRKDLPSIVKAMAKKEGVAFTERAANALIDRVGENTVRLDAEVKKIALAHVGTDSVTDAEVARAVVATAEIKPWVFLDHFAARDIRACLLDLRKLKGTSPFGLISMCSIRIRELICAKALEARGMQRSLARELGMQEWRVKHHLQWARGFTAEELRAALVRARDAEKAMKSGTDEHEAFLDFVLDVVPRTPRQ